MTTHKKYDYRITQDGSAWNAEIIRRVTSKRTAVSKSQEGFASEAEARAWGEKELKSFLENLVARNKRDSAQRRQGQPEKAPRPSPYKKSKQD